MSAVLGERLIRCPTLADNRVPLISQNGASVATTHFVIAEFSLVRNLILQPTRDAFALHMLQFMTL